MTILAMFPIIPHHLSGRASPGDCRRKASVTVLAGGHVPAHTCSPPIPLETILRARLPQHKMEVVVEADAEGRLVAKNSPGEDGVWLRHARVSPDCHSYNVLVHRLPDCPAVRVRTTRDLRPGDELCLWFDEDTLATAAIPFLTPGNIQGEKNYICHLCSKRFEYPNPLKIHLALACGSLRRVELWRRLMKSEEAKISNTNESALLRDCDKKTVKGSLGLKNPSKTQNIAPPSPESGALSTASNPSTFEEEKMVEDLDRPSSEPTISRFSAFKPYLSFQPSKHNSPQYLTPNPMISIPSNLLYSSPFSTQNPPRILPPQISIVDLSGKSGIQNDLIDRQAVEMETLVSNLGRSKQGHLCIYCGKIYSRKYGLKIHIRTHTGFKPLKCKFCLRPFGDPSNLNKHVRLHAEGETPYKCEECGKVLVRRRDLERHIKSRHQ